MQHGKAVAGPAADAPPSKDLVPAKPLVMRIGKRLQPWVNGVVARASAIGDAVFPDRAAFPWIETIEANWRAIAAEAAEVCRDPELIPPLAEISPDHRRIAPAGKWRSFFLSGYGYTVDENVRRCPRTAALVKRVPGLNSALFSVLAPGTHIPLHTGVTKAFLTCHLGLVVPDRAEDCRMWVAGEPVTWTPGRAFVFDDCYPHEVRNDTDQTRVVLLIQFRRPMRLTGRIIGGLFLWGVKKSRFVQEARAGVMNWGKQPGVSART